MASIQSLQSLFLNSSRSHLQFSTAALIAVAPTQPNYVKFLRCSTEDKNRRPRELYFSGKLSLFKSVRSLAPPVHGAEVSTLQSAETPKPSAAGIVADFYEYLRLRDEDALAGVLADDCVYHCMAFARPFTGKQAVMRFLRSLMDSMGSGMQFVVDGLTEGHPHKVGVLWHLEWKEIPLPFGKGCSFYDCEIQNEQILIRHTEVFNDSPMKHGHLTLIFIRMVAILLEIFPNLAGNIEHVIRAFQLVFLLMFIFVLGRFFMQK